MKLTQIHPANTIARINKATAVLFATLPEPTNEPLNINELREAVTAWDREAAFTYPAKLPADSFKEEFIKNIPISIYRTDDSPDKATTVLFIHGGGFVCELENVHKSLMANIAAITTCHGILPHYSLAPETKAPTAITEITTLLKAILTDPKQYGVSKNLILVGYSSGGNLALNATLKLLHSEHKQLVKHISQVVLMSPWNDVSMQTTQQDIYPEQALDSMLQANTLMQMKDYYLPDGYTGMEPELSPLYHSANAMKGMPPTTIIAGECECLLTDAIATTSLLQQSGTETHLVILEGQTHNHSAHSGLGCITSNGQPLTAAIISQIINGDDYSCLKSRDGFGLKVTAFNNMKEIKL